MEPHVKRVKSHLPIMLLSLLLAQSAAAQSEDGPFFSRQQLVDYWTVESAGSSHAVHVFINAYMVYAHFGFGPALGKSYFQCADGLIRKDCSSISGPFRSGSDAVAFLDSVFGGHSHFNIMLDSATLHLGFGPVVGSFRFKTCYGQYYNGYPLSYVVLEYGYAFNYSYPPMACLPPP
jgi:hypothetical protein